MHTAYTHGLHKAKPGSSFFGPSFFGGCGLFVCWLLFFGCWLLWLLLLFFFFWGGVPTTFFFQCVCVCFGGVLLKICFGLFEAFLFEVLMTIVVCLLNTISRDCCSSQKTAGW